MKRHKERVMPQYDAPAGLRDSIRRIELAADRGTAGLHNFGVAGST